MIMQVKINCICGKLDLAYLIKCYICKQYSHKECIEDFKDMPKFICPKCQLKYGEIFLDLEDNIFIEKIVLNNLHLYKSYNYSKKIIFKIPFNIYNKIINDMNNNNINKNKVLIIRGLIINKNGFNFTFPLNFNLYFKINKKNIISYQLQKTKYLPLIFFTKNLFSLENYYYCNISQNYYLKLNNKKLTNNLKFKDFFNINNIKNLIEIEINFSKNEIKKEDFLYSKFILSIDYVELHDSSINEIKNIINKSDTIYNLNLLKEKLNIYLLKDSLINLDEAEVIDNFTNYDIIQYPARGIFCTHVRCFDLFKFLNLNLESKKFRCGICNKQANIFYLDEYFNNYLEEGKKLSIKNGHKLKSIIFDKEYKFINYVFEKDDLNYINLSVEENEEIFTEEQKNKNNINKGDEEIIYVDSDNSQNIINNSNINNIDLLNKEKKLSKENVNNIEKQDINKLNNDNDKIINNNKFIKNFKLKDNNNLLIIYSYMSQEKLLEIYDIVLNSK